MSIVKELMEEESQVESPINTESRKDDSPVLPFINLMSCNLESPHQPSPEASDLIPLRLSSIHDVRTQSNAQDASQPGMAYPPDREERKGNE